MNKEQLKTQFLEYFNLWDLEIEGLDSQEDYEESIQMFDYIINIQYKFISDKKDLIMRNFKDDKDKMYNELNKFENSKGYKTLINIHDYALKLQNRYKKLYTLKNRRTKQNIKLRTLIKK